MVQLSQNLRQLQKMKKTVKLIDIANRANENLESADAKEILKVIGNYSKALDLLDDYDHRTLLKPKGSNSKKQIKYEDCLEIIKKLRFNEESGIFAIERNKGLESIIGMVVFIKPLIVKMYIKVLKKKPLISYI